jgi:hypothetical protein
MCKSPTHSFQEPTMLQPFPYEQLWHYSEKFTRDADLRQDLVLLAWQQDKRFGEKSEIRLLKHFMKYRAKEITSRNSLGKSVGSKSKRDVWRHDRVSISKRLMDGSAFTLADTLSSVGYDPLGTCIVNEFEDALLEREADVAEQMVSGYNDSEAAKTLRLLINEYRLLKNQVREKAMEYLE